MTRIVSGRWSGRRLAVPRDRRVRPTAERVREAWLQMLAGELVGARVLDLFAGSGALGFEALSRGAAHATFVDIAGAAVTALHRNVEALDAGDITTVRRGDALRHLATVVPGTYDLVLADPPFTIDFAARIATIWRERRFAPVCAIEHSARVQLGMGDTRTWGDIAVTFLRSS